MKGLYSLVRRRPIAPSPWHSSKLFHPCLLLSHFLKNGHPGQVKVSRDDPRQHTGANSTSFFLTVIRHHPPADESPASAALMYQRPSSAPAWDLDESWRNGPPGMQRCVECDRALLTTPWFSFQTTTICQSLIRVFPLLCLAEVAAKQR